MNQQQQNDRLRMDSSWSHRGGLKFTGLIFALDSAVVKHKISLARRNLKILKLIILLDLIKAFDKVNRNALISWRHNYWIQGQALNCWIQAFGYRSQRVVIDGEDMLPVLSR